MTITLRIVPAVLLCLAFAPLSFARVATKKAIVAYVFVKDAVLGPNDVAAGSLTRVNYAFANIENGKIVEGFAHDRENFQARYVLRHPWRGPATCFHAAAYRDELQTRFKEEAKNLSYLTGWTVADIENRMAATGEPIWKK